jgi:biopolymer transport protein TolR
MQAGGGGGGEGHASSVYRGLRSRRSGSGALSEINVTPLVDVVLVLLLVFMITAPMMSRGIDVSLPQANQPQIQPDDRLTVTVNAEGRLYVNGTPVNVLRLEDELRGKMMGRERKVAYLSADRALVYGKVIEVVDVMKRAGVEQIGFVYVLPEAKK